MKKTITFLYRATKWTLVKAFKLSMWIITVMIMFQIVGNRKAIRDS